LSAQGLRRIQRFYDIPASEMAAGRFVDRVIGDEMNGNYKVFVVKRLKSLPERAPIDLKIMEIVHEIYR